MTAGPVDEDRERKMKGERTEGADGAGLLALARDIAEASSTGAAVAVGQILAVRIRIAVGRAVDALVHSCNSSLFQLHEGPEGGIRLFACATSILSPCPLTPLPVLHGPQTSHSGQLNARPSPRGLETSLDGGRV